MIEYPIAELIAFFPLGRARQTRKLATSEPVVRSVANRFYMFLLVLQRLFIEFVFDVLYFPLWWYGPGLFRVLRFAIELFKDGNRSLAPALWLKNIFVPMFGQTDIGGRLMSIFMRFVNVIGRSTALFVWLIGVALIIIVWLAVPVFISVMLARSLMA